jgi:hypothetical protein
MTMAAKAPKRRKRGRPRRDYSNDPDLAVAELAIALQAGWNLSERKAFDLALVACQGELRAFSKRPRGAKQRRRWRGGGVALLMGKSFASRNADIRRKLKDGRLRPDAQVVLEMARLLHRALKIKR